MNKIKKEIKWNSLYIVIIIDLFNIVEYKISVENNVLLRTFL
jgi:hypothetical protein